MDQPSCAVMMVVVVLVELAKAVNHAAKVFVLANQIVLDVNVVMMDVDINPAVNAHPHKPAKMVCVLEHQHLIAQEELVDPTEPGEVVVLAPLVKDAVLVNASVTTIVMKEIVEMLSNLPILTLQLALKDLVVLAHPVSLVVRMEDVPLKLHVPFSLQSLIVPPDEPFHRQVQFSLHKPLSVTVQPSLFQPELLLHGILLALEISPSKQLLKDIWSTLKLQLSLPRPLLLNSV